MAAGSSTSQTILGCMPALPRMSAFVFRKGWPVLYSTKGSSAISCSEMLCRPAKRCPGGRARLSARDTRSCARNFRYRIGSRWRAWSGYCGIGRKCRALAMAVLHSVIYRVYPAVLPQTFGQSSRGSDAYRGLAEGCSQ